MNKFIFVCYQHGTGGEVLSVEISKLPFCQHLRYEKHSGRTWTFDCFDKLFLKEFRPDWEQKAAQVKPSELVRVVPSHYRPEKLKKLFPDDIFIVINSPSTKSGLTKLLKRIYKQVWLTKHHNLEQKIGYFIQCSGKKPNRDQIKILNKDISNGGIQCLINEEKITKEMIKKLFRVWAKDFRPLFHYKDGHNLFAIDYPDIGVEVIQNLKNKLTRIISVV